MTPGIPLRTPRRLPDCEVDFTSDREEQELERAAGIGEPRAGRLGRRMQAQVRAAAWAADASTLRWLPQAGPATEFFRG